MITNLFNTAVDILRTTRTTDDMGGATEVDVVFHNNLKCRINWSRGNERMQFDKDTWVRDAKLYCSVVDILTTDRVRYKSKIYEIVNVSDADEVGKYLTVEIKLIQ